MREPFDPRDHGAALRFGAAIKFVDALRAEPLDPFLLQPRRHRRGHVEHDLEARKIVAVAHLLGQRPDPMHHGRHEIDPLHAAALDQPQRFLGVEFCHAGDPAAVEQRGVRHDERRVVIERPGIEQRSAGRLAERRHGRGIGHRGLMIEDDFGASGRAAAGHGLPVARHRIVQRFVRHAFRDKIDRQ